MVVIICMYFLINIFWLFSLFVRASSDRKGMFYPLPLMIFRCKKLRKPARIILGILAAILLFPSELIIFCLFWGAIAVFFTYTKIAELCIYKNTDFKKDNSEMRKCFLDCATYPRELCEVK